MHIGIYFDCRHLGDWNWRAFFGGELGLSGTDSQIPHLAYRLAKHGYRVTFFTPKEMNCFGEIESIEVEDLAAAVKRSKENGNEVLIFNDRNNPETFAGIEQCERTSQPALVWIQNSPSPEMANLLQASKMVLRVICVSAIQADWLRDHPVFEKIEVVHNSIAEEFYCVDDTVKHQPLSVCYLGSLVPSKGFQHLARVWPKVRGAFPEASLTVLGSARLYDRNVPLGPLGVSTQEFESAHIIPFLGATREEAQIKGVTFMGLMSPQEIRKIIGTCSIGVVNPIYGSETFCVSAVEIQALGTAVIGGNGGGLKETVRHGQTGILVGSQAELHAALVTLLSVPGLARSMGETGIKWVQQNFRSDLIIDRWCSVLAALAMNKPPQPPAFSWRRSSPRVVLRELIRQGRKIPFVGRRLPTLHAIRHRLAI